MCDIIFTGVRGEVNDDLEEEARRDPMLTRVEEVNKGWDRGGELGLIPYKKIKLQ